MATTQQIAAAERALMKKDPVLGAFIELQRPVLHAPRTNYFFSLARAITGQQISVAAAATIFKRLEAATGLDPVRVAALSDAEAKSVGLSKQKLAYLRDLAAHFERDPAVYNHLGSLPDNDVIRELTAIKGIGVWTAQMFLMFTLARLDVFAPDDVGLQRAMQRMYGWDTLPPKAELERFAERWRPYRTVACWHLWKSLHNDPDM